MRECGIPASPVQVLTGRDGGIQYYYDGRHLSRGDWPGQRTLYAAGTVPGQATTEGRPDDRTGRS